MTKKKDDRKSSSGLDKVRRKNIGKERVKEKGTERVTPSMRKRRKKVGNTQEERRPDVIGCDEGIC
ncbi:hypothetical protein E2C01_054102 [Portunus trituberculatus]|uniref:Uncharacterized protein n=1 Tax=Portunus trituberculatus TaxID=210409 RepID=A0A5B7GR17_PORTR|nr:hypothetical protein [Portunus trituberculatus]